MSDLNILRGAGLRDRLRARLLAARAAVGEMSETPLGEELRAVSWDLDTAARIAVERLEFIIERAAVEPGPRGPRLPPYRTDL